MLTKDALESIERAALLGGVPLPPTVAQLARELLTTRTILEAVLHQLTAGEASDLLNAAASPGDRDAARDDLRWCIAELRQALGQEEAL
jgi:hypothetical protein